MISPLASGPARQGRARQIAKTINHFSIAWKCARLYWERLLNLLDLEQFLSAILGKRFHQKRTGSASKLPVPPILKPEDWRSSHSIVTEEHGGARLSFSSDAGKGNPFPSSHSGARQIYDLCFCGGVELKSRAQRCNSKCVGQYTSSGITIRYASKYTAPATTCWSWPCGPRAQFTSNWGRQK